MTEQDLTDYARVVVKYLLRANRREFIDNPRKIAATIPGACELTLDELRQTVRGAFDRHQSLFERGHWSADMNRLVLLKSIADAVNHPVFPESWARMQAETGMPEWDELRGRAPGATGDLSSEAFVRNLRDEWE